MDKTPAAAQHGHKGRVAHHHNHHQHRTKMRDIMTDILKSDKEYVDYPEITSGDQALARLKSGNKTWADGRIDQFIQHLVNEITPEVRHELAKSQKPYAVILTCADSRVAPELIFDEGLGLLFCVRVAGNVIDKMCLGSIEYAVEHLKVKLLLVMGHQSCGAVKAAVDTVIAEAENKAVHDDSSIASIVQSIKPVVLHVKETHDLVNDYQNSLDICVQENAALCMKTILSSSKIIKEHVDSKALHVAVAEYKLDTGVVDFSDAHFE